MNQDCWNQIGVMGDRTCPDLEKFIHCRNCPVYSAEGRRLLEREAPAKYRDEWTTLLAQEGTKIKSDRSSQDSLATVSQNLDIQNKFSVLIFRLGVEWFALSAKLFREVTQPTVIHTVPHRSNQIFLGVANVSGELLLCISLLSLLGIEPTDSTRKNVAKNIRFSPVVYQRMIVIEKEGNSWGFEVDEIYGIHRVNPENLRNVPAVNAGSNRNYTQGIIKWDERSVNLLDDELLFYTLERRIL
jgi:chemotaxis-related protein WspD